MQTESCLRRKRLGMTRCPRWKRPPPRGLADGYRSQQPSSIYTHADDGYARPLGSQGTGSSASCVSRCVSAVRDARERATLKLVFVLKLFQPCIGRAVCVKGSSKIETFCCLARTKRWNHYQTRVHLRGAKECESPSQVRRVSIVKP
jgi:hypothetical protein